MTFTAGHSYTWTLTDSDFPSTSNATLTVVNNSTATIWNLYMSTSSSTLGIDQLATSTISAGSTYNITGIAPGYYYLRAVHSGTYDTAYTTQTFAAGQSYTWTLTNSDFPGTSSATLTVVNNSATTIGWVYMSTSSLSIGTDRLGISSISAGSAFNITGIAPGYYHIRAVHLNTHDTAYSDITIAAGQTYSWTLTGSDFSGGSVVGLKVINNSSYTINYVYLSKSNTAWGSDWLGSNTISSGYYYIIPNVPTGTVNSKFVTSGSGLNSLHLLNIPGNGSDSITLTDSDFPNYLHGSLKVVNNWTSSIYYLKYRLTGTTAWSTDQLGTSTIISGGQYQLNLITPGTYDFLVLSSGQTYSLELDNQVISDGQLLTWTVPGLY
jgi:hypothetical protein